MGSADASLPDPAKAIVVVVLDGPGRQRMIQCPKGATTIPVAGWTSITVHVAPVDPADVGLEHG